MNWFADNVSISVGDGSLVLFWHYRWLGYVLLKVLFPRLFQVSAMQEVTITEFGSCKDGKWHWCFSVAYSINNVVLQSDSLELLDILKGDSPIPPSSAYDSFR